MPVRDSASAMASAGLYTRMIHKGICRIIHKDVMQGYTQSYMQNRYKKSSNLMNTELVAQDSLADRQELTWIRTHF